MIIIILILLVASSCTSNDTGYSLPYDLPDEVGTWVSVSDTTYESPYYLIGDSIYVGYISLTNESPREFFSKRKSNSFLVRPLTDVDITSFEVNINEDNSYYARDKKAIYYPRGTAYDSGPVFIDGNYGGGELYYGDITIEGADPQTFQYIGKGYAFDINNMYYRGQRIEWNDNIISALLQDDCPKYLPIDYGMSNDEK